MTVDVMKEIGDRSGVIDRRFMIGILFPMILGVTSCYVIYAKILPPDLLSWTCIILISFVIALLFIELAPQVCWKVSRTGKNYENFLKDNIENLFIQPIEAKIKEFNINTDHYKKIILSEYSIFRKNAKDDYISTFFIPNRRYNHDMLILSETRFLFYCTINFTISLNLLLATVFSIIPIDFWIIKRDKIVDLSIPLIITFLILLTVFISVLILYYRDFWRVIISSTNVTFPESEREKNVRESGRETLLKFITGEIFNKSELIGNELIQDTLKGIVGPYIREEFKYNNQKELLRRTHNTIIEKNKDRLKIDDKQITYLSTDLSDKTRITKYTFQRYPSQFYFMMILIVLLIITLTYIIIDPSILFLEYPLFSFEFFPIILTLFSFVATSSFYLKKSRF